MATVAKLKVVMEADSHRLTSALSRVKKQVFNIRTAFGVLAGAGGIGAVVGAQLKATDEMAKFSKRIGISTEALSELRHAAKLSGVQTNTLHTSLQRMTRRMGELASMGKGEAKSALEKLGLDAKDLAKRAPEDQLSALADALADVESESERVALAAKIFDSEGVAMLQMLENGSAGLDEMRRSARGLGLTVTAQMAEDAERANDSMTKLVGSVNALAQVFATGLAPELADALSWVVDVLPKFVAGFKTVGTVIGASMAQWAAIIRGDFSGAAAIGGLSISDIYREQLGGGAEGENTAEAIGKATGDAFEKALDRTAIFPIAG